MTTPTRKALKRKFDTLECSTLRIHANIVSRAYTEENERALLDQLKLIRSMRIEYALPRKQSNPTTKFQHYAFKLKPDLVLFISECVSEINQSEFPLLFRGLISSRSISPIATLIGCKPETKLALETRFPSEYERLDMANRRVSIPVLTSVIHRQRGEETTQERHDKDILVDEFAKLLKLKEARRR